MNRFLALALVLLALPCAMAAASKNGYETRVVGLSVTYQNWNEDQPWAKLSPRTRTAAGVVVPGPYVLTTAQMVSRSTFIQLVKNGRPTPFELRPVLVDEEVNLALLGAEDPAALAGLEPTTLAPETPKSGRLSTVRWNEQQLEVLALRVQRFDVQESHFGRFRHVFMLGQTDATGGGWSEPVFDESKLVGLTVGQSKQTATVLPAEILKLFLERAAAEGGYAGFPIFGAYWQTNRDPSVTTYLGLEGDPRGVLMRQVPWGSSACGVIRPRDIVLAIDGVPINAEGYYEHPRFGRLEYTQLLAEKAVGESVEVELLRDGEIRRETMRLRRYPIASHLVRVWRSEPAPAYFIAGGLIFRELDAEYLSTWGDGWSKKAPMDLVSLYRLKQEAQSPGQRRMILIHSILPSEYTVGYDSLENALVRRINGQDIDSIDDVVAAFEKPQGEFHVIDLNPLAGRRQIVLAAQPLEAVTRAVLQHYQIPADRRLPPPPPEVDGPLCVGDYE